MKEAKDAAESALADNQRASLIRATKMNAAACRLFIDFLFVASSAQIDSILPKRRLSRRPELSKYVSDHDLIATMPSISTEI
jgi:hypothetical protein